MSYYIPDDPLAEVRTLTAELFHQVFDQLSDPVFLRSGDDWLFNPAAQTMGLSANDLQQLEDWGDDAFIWLSLRFYRVSAQHMDGALLLILRPDAFLAEAAQNVASQLRQRLQSAFGCASDLSQTEGVRTNIRARERLAGINRELYQLLRMAQQLELSGQSDALICQQDCFDLVSAFLQLSDELRELLQSTGVELKVDIEPTSLVMSADVEKLKYLVLSLVSNAMPHLPKAGGRIVLGLKEQKGQAVITVSDNGSGFSPDLLSHPLWNEPRRLVFGRGLGLGLPLVQRIAAAHEGTVMVFPSPKGSRVTVSIPIDAPKDTFTSPLPPPRSPNGFSMAKVLLSNALPRSVYYPNPEGDD